MMDQEVLEALKKVRKDRALSDRYREAIPAQTEHKQYLFQDLRSVSAKAGLQMGFHRLLYRRRRLSIQDET